MFDYGKLLSRIKFKFGTVTKFAEVVDIKYTTLLKKLNNQSEFSQDEMVKIKKALNLENYSTYFFDEVNYE